MTRLLVLAWIAMLARLAVAFAIAHRVAELGPGADYNRADFQHCVAVPGGPLVPEKGIIIIQGNAPVSRVT